MKQLQQEQQQSQARQQQLLESLRQGQQQSHVQQQITEHLNHGKQQQSLRQEHPHQIQMTQKNAEEPLQQGERLLSDELQVKAQKRLMQQMEQAQIQSQKLLQQSDQEDDLLLQLEEHIQREQFHHQYEPQEADQQTSLQIHKSLHDERLLQQLHNEAIQRFQLNHKESHPKEGIQLLQGELLTTEQDQLIFESDHISDSLQQPALSRETFLDSVVSHYASVSDIPTSPRPASSPAFQPPSLNTPDYMRENIISPQENAMPTTDFLGRTDFVAFASEELYVSDRQNFETKVLLESQALRSPSVPPTSFLRQALLASTQALAKMRNSMTTTVVRMTEETKHTDVTFRSQLNEAILVDHFEGNKH